MYIYSDLFPGKSIDNNLTINKQIEVMKEKIDEEDKKLQEKNYGKNKEIKIELNKKIDQIFIDMWKKRRSNNVKGGKNNSSKIFQKKKNINNTKISLFTEFTHGFYRK